MVQNDGKVLAGGFFRDGDNSGTPGAVIRRYNSDGSVDTGFKFPAKLDLSLCNAIIPQLGGKILVAGFATDYTTGSYFDRRLFFLNADGSVDSTYKATGATTTAYAPSVLLGGKIVYLASYNPPAGQAITSKGGLPRRLNADGSADTSFNPQLGSGAFFTSLVVQANGQIVVGGYTRGDSDASAGVVRLNADGSTDANFQSGSGTGYGGKVDYAYVAPDDSVVVAGLFNSFDDQERFNVAGLYGDGGLNLPFFVGEAGLGNGAYYLSFTSGNAFGYYSFLSDLRYLYHYDLGYEYIFDAADGKAGVYLYDFASSTFFYTSPSFPFPYLYDFSLNTVLYYYPDPNNPGRYNTDGTRYFYDFATGQIISK